MALKPCRECGAQVSTAAEVCPHCGVRSPAICDPLAILDQGRNKQDLPRLRSFAKFIRVMLYIGAVGIGMFVTINLIRDSNKSGGAHVLSQCESASARDALKQAIEIAPFSKIVNVSVFEIQNQRTIDNSSDVKRLCKATVLLNSGKHEIGYSIECVDTAKTKIYLQTTSWE